MILVNPFTGMVLNANPEGCNQHTGPECSRRWVKPSDEVIDLKPGEYHADAVAKEISSLGRKPGDKSRDYADLMKSGYVRVNTPSFSEEVNVDLDENVSLDRLVSLILSKKIPNSKKFFIGRTGKDGYVKDHLSGSLEDLMGSRSWEEFKRRRRYT
jgi:hypothetical protein